LENFLTKLFGSRNQRLLRSYKKSIAIANGYEADLKKLTAGELQARTDVFRQRLADGETMDELLPEAYAVVREASRRTLGLRHFDEQLAGGIALHQGKIAEMRTGEGKTLVATLPAYLHALSGGSVHVVTVNEYLARRDSDWMRPVFEFLGISVGVIHSGQSPEEKRAAYAAGITYGTNNEFGFDYLRDNLAFRPEDQVQRSLDFAIVDEVDSILIDEARTPLIISGPSEDSTDLYVGINRVIPKLKRQPEEGRKRNEDIVAAQVMVIMPDGEERGPMAVGKAVGLAAEQGYDLVETDPAAKVPVCRLLKSGDYTVDEKSKQAFLTEEGHEHVEQLLTEAGLIAEGESLYDPANIRLMHHVTAALRAHAVFKRDIEYIVQDGEIIIVDEFTGRTMPGRRWSDGLHQAIEAKEGVPVKEENQTVASITFQNYFRMYDTLSGMTGTADTEAYEFQQIYGLEVVVIPTHKPMIRDDQPDLVYLTQKDKFAAIIEDIKECRARHQPVLVGTTSIETSEYLSGLLKKENFEHQVLNAKQHEREAQIIVDAGRPGTVTIATNMAGRGTDIVLGGNLEAELKQLGENATEEEIQRCRADWEQRHEQVIEAGGLRIIGTERHESRRIDNQLRGRAGRQGDPGSSRFYLSMEDNLMRIFGDPSRTKSMLSRVGMREGEAIESRLLSRQIERAQRKVEAHNFDARKSLLEYDDVANDQRHIVYSQRNELMVAEDIGDVIEGIAAEVIGGTVDAHLPPDSIEDLWDIPALEQVLDAEFGARLKISAWLQEDPSLGPEEIRERVIREVREQYEKKAEQIGIPIMRQFEKAVMLQQLDMHWKEHLGAMDYLRQHIGLRSYAQKNPKQEYKREAFEMFSMMLEGVKHDVISILSRAQVRSQEDVEAVDEQRRASRQMQFRHADAPSAIAGQSEQDAGEAPPATPFIRSTRKVGRNEPCPCGSGKKYKHCHGRIS